MSWVPESFSFCQGLTAFYQLLFLPILLWTPGEPARSIFATSQEDGHTALCCSFSFQNFAKAYRHWNNPRQLTLRGRVLGSKETKRTGWGTVAGFTLRRGVKVTVLHLINIQIIQPVFDHVMSNAMLVDFAPQSEPILRRVLFASPTSTLDSEQLAVRVLVSFHWIWHDFLTLETCHGALAVLFVAILGVDHVDEWPALYGNPLTARSVKGFWGRYWHRLMTTTYSWYARIFSRTICRSRPDTSSDKALIALGVFAISGLGHALVNWRLNEVALARDPMFFLANFAAVAAETYVAGFIKVRLTKSRYDSLARSWKVTTLGYIWVWCWFVWIVPRWEFPRIYHGWIKAAVETKNL